MRKGKTIGATRCDSFLFPFFRFFREWSFQSKKLCVGEIINLTQWYGKAEKRGEEKRGVYLLGEKVK